MTAHFRLGVALEQAEVDRARKLEARVFAHAFGNTADQLAEEYDAWADRTFFLTVTDADGRVVGALRVITAADRPTKTLLDCAAPPWSADPAGLAVTAGLDLTSTWDIATLAVDPALTGHPARTEIALALYHGLDATSTAAMVRSMTAMLDDRVLARLRSLGMTWRPLPGLAAAPYLGSASTTPVYLHLADTHARIAGNAALHALLVRGEGFTHVSLPPAHHWRPAPSARPQPAV